MKRIYSIMFAAVAIFTAASCQKELADNTLPTGGDFKITATIDVDTKTALVDDVEGNKIYWTPGDKISVFNASGEAVSFSTDIVSNSLSATFTNDTEFTAPDGELLAVYNPTREAAYADGVITTLRVGGAQNAVKGSFDKDHAITVGTPVSAGSRNLVFNNVHSLVKFTVGGDSAPSTVTLACNGARAICGLLNYNPSTGEITQGDGEKTITLNGPFEVGGTYYIAVIPGVVGNGISLKFDGITVKNTGVTATIEQNKIINLGTVKMPDVQLTATQKLAKQSSGATSFMTTFGGTANTNRNVGMDNNYVYIAETQGSPVLWKIALADGTASKMPVATVNGTATHALACPRMIPNSDASINNGNDVLVVCSMGMDGQNTFLYVYNNGIENDPTKLSLNTVWMGRRVGDKFTYLSGNNGVTTLFMKDYNSGALLTFDLTMKDGSVSCTEATSRTYLLANTTESGAGAFYVYPGTASSAEGMYASTEKGSYVVRKDDVLTLDKPTYVAQWVDLAKFQGCHGFNFFTLGGKNYIAYTKYSDQTVYVIKGAADAAGVKAALAANDVVWSAKIAANDNACVSGHSGADCAVSVIDENNVYVAGNIQNVGVVVYKLSVE